MRDLAPVALVVTDQHLVIQTIGLGIHLQHVIGEPEKLGHIVDG